MIFGVRYKCIKALSAFFCPEKYNDDLENDLICNLWIDLQVMKFEIEISETTTMAPQNNVTCEFAQHPTSFHSLCEVWCQIQELHGDQCIYCLSELMEAPDGKLLCSLWEQLINLQNSDVGSTVAPFSSYESCPHNLNVTDPKKVCDLWCDVQEFDGTLCCPSEFVGAANEMLLCEMWNELQNLQESSESFTTISPLMPVKCIYSNTSDDSVLLCDLWCQIQVYKGFECVQCPQEFKEDPANPLLCDLWFEIETLNHEIETSEETTTMSPTTNLTCKYKDHPTSSDPLCNVWCKIQKLKGLQCIFCPDEYKTNPAGANLCRLWGELVELENSEKLTTISNPQYEICKYETHNTSSQILCDLWCQVQTYKEELCCPELYIGDNEEQLLCQLWTELEELKESVSNVSTIMPVSPTQCIYEKNPTSSELLCDLWCDIQAYDGLECIQCPKKYKDDPEEEELCNLWFELSSLNSTYALLPPTSNFTVCPFINNPTSSTSLCELWCTIQTFKGGKCIDPCPDKYRDHPDETLLCDLWDELQIQATEYEEDPTLTTTDNQPTTCLYHDHSSSEDLCDLWCQVQAYKGSECAKTTTGATITTTSPPCPSLYTSRQEVELLCILWTTLSELESSLGAAPQSGSGFLPVPCEHRNNSEDATLLCDLWCKIQLYENKTCIDQNCPLEYFGDDEEILLCDLRSNLTNLQINSASEEGMPSHHDDDQFIPRNQKKSDTSERHIM